MASAIQTVPALLTLEEYLSTSYRPDCEFVDGQLEERNVGGTNHGLLQMQLGIWFFQHSEWNLRTVGINDGLKLVEGTVLPVANTPIFLDLAQLFSSLQPRSVRGL
jgi:hypothetical protein